jgi:hypothetical protein
MYPSQWVDTAIIRILGVTFHPSFCLLSSKRRLFPISSIFEGIYVTLQRIYSFIYNHSQILWITEIIKCNAKEGVSSVNGYS